ncbi:MAG: hypothetical protein MUP47_00705 [Phycisphaerae bacterium]|nr:hypothetical protein [Phycisphaerae bacterium]
MTDPLRPQPLLAHTLNEVRYYLTVAVCPSCGKGPRELDHAEGPEPASRLAVVTARCRHCSHQDRLEFLCRHDAPTEGVEAETINPDTEPSTIIDLAQWLSLFYLLVESAAGDSSPVATRRRGYQAALCLAEALKFYGDDELPPASAFFGEASAEIFRLHPEKFARQKLRDMQAKLPALAVMARRVARDERSPRRPWWRFWRR